uniref:Immunoglobulin V-set domain-containing protein n=1 Tax=Gallus gallus TaxID=9031 RepID=A0A8V0YVI4_CHICK
MLLRLAVLAVFSLLLIDGHAQVLLQQHQPYVIKKRSKTVTIQCQLSSGTVVHWYKQLPGEPPKRILYMSGNSPTFDYSNDRQNSELPPDAYTSLCHLSLVIFCSRIGKTKYQHGQCEMDSVI